MKFDEKRKQHNVVYCDPIPSEEYLQKFYAERYYQEALSSYELSYTDEEIEHKNFVAELLFYCISLHQTDSALKKYQFVDMGCGEGFSLNFAQKQGFAITGVDYSEYGIQKWHPHLMDSFIKGDLINFTNDKNNYDKFDVCFLISVLEHSPSPEKLLKGVHSILKTNGKFVVTVPNDYSKLQMLLLKNNLVDTDEWFCPPDHCAYFNTENIKAYMEDFNFKVVDMYTSFPVDLFLLNKHSNYYFDRNKGKAAHHSRIKTELLIRKSGLENTLNFCRAMANAGIGRTVTVVMDKA